MLSHSSLTSANQGWLDGVFTALHVFYLKFQRNQKVQFTTESRCKESNWQNWILKFCFWGVDVWITVLLYQHTLDNYTILKRETGGLKGQHHSVRKITIMKGKWILTLFERKILFREGHIWLYFNPTQTIATPKSFHWRGGHTCQWGVALLTQMNSKYCYFYVPSLIN